MTAARGFTVNPDGSINAATVEEALQLSDAILARQRTSQPAVSERKQVNGHSPTQKFIQMLKPHSGEVMDAVELAKVIGVDSPAGVGPKLRHLKMAFEQDHLSLSDYLEGSKNGKDPMEWRVK